METGAGRKGLYEKKCKSDTEQWRWEKEDQTLGRLFPKGPDWVGVFALMLVGLSKDP